jgi:hypothetical protein
VGVTHKALKAFLVGARPHPSTVRKLQGWYEASFAPELNRAAEAVRTLLEPIPPPGRHSAMERVLTLIEELYGEFGVEPPASLRQLRPQGARTHEDNSASG